MNENVHFYFQHATKLKGSISCKNCVNDDIFIPKISTKIDMPRIIIKTKYMRGHWVYCGVTYSWFGTGFLYATDFAVVSCLSTGARGCDLSHSTFLCFL